MSSSTKSDDFTPLVESEPTSLDESEPADNSTTLGNQDSTITETDDDEEISPIAKESINTLSVETPSAIADDDADDDGLACLDKIRSLLESGKSAKSKLAQIRDIINSTSGGKKKSRKVHKNHKKGKNSRKKQRKGSRK